MYRYTQSNEPLILSYRVKGVALHRRCRTCLVFLQLGFMCCLSSLGQSVIPVLNLMTQLSNLCNTQRKTDRLVLEHCITQNSESRDR